MTIKFSEKDQIITAYSFDENMVYNVSFEYCWVKDTGLAAKSTDIAPPETSEGEVAVFDIEMDQWDIKSDHRGKEVYNTETLELSKVDYVGPIKSGYTELKPNSIHETWTGSEWIDQRTDEQKVNDEILELLPLTRRQFRLALINNGYNLSEIEQTIGNIEDDLQRQTIQIEWEDAQTFERTSASLNTMAGLLGLENKQINDLWNKALKF